MTLGPEVGLWERVREEGRDDGRLGDYLVVQDTIGDFDAGDETAGVDGEVFFGAGHGEVDEYFLVRKVELFKGYVGTVGPRAGMRSI